MRAVQLFALNFIFPLAQIAFADGQVSAGANAAILFQEPFEDANFAARGWYDALRGTLTQDEHIAGSTASLECRFLRGATSPAGGTPGRHLFSPTETVYVSYYVKYSVNYTGSNRPYHPHEFHVLTTENDRYVGPAYTHLTLYIEQNEGVPLLAIQDGENIDESNIGVDLTGITEQRAIAGCNGDSDGHGAGDCYLSGAAHRNGKQWRAGGVYFRDATGPYYKNDWHFVEAFFALNSIVEGKGVPDGVLKYWYDGELLIDHDNVMYRTGHYPNMKFNQFLMAPYIGDGSPVEQVMWIDDLTVATARVISGLGEKQSDKTSKADAIVLQNYPNPFNRQTTIFYKLSQPGNVELAIYDVMGKSVAPLVSEQQSAGSYKYNWDAGSVASGIYVIRFMGDDFVRVKKLILLK